MSETTREKFFEVLGKFDTAVLATVNSEGKVHARPMAIFHLEDDGSVLFITDESSAKVYEIENERHATIICQDGWKSTVTLTGSASIARDAAKVREHWRKGFQAWFPEGPDDPRIVLVRVRGQVGEYWDSSGVKAFRYAAQAAKAIVSGSRPKVDDQEQHAKVALK